MRRTVVIVGFCFLALLFLGEGFADVGIVLTDLAGDSVSVDSLLATGPVVLNFWATWCGPCRIEMPHLQKVHAETESLGVHFAAISLDNARSKSRVEQYIKKQGVTLPVYQDANGSVARLFKIMAIPTTIVLNSKGETHHLARGYRPGDEIILRKKIDEVLKAYDREDQRDAAR
jgi:thiol-disulfide isomerase/thioredoxin